MPSPSVTGTSQTWTLDITQRVSQFDSIAADFPRIANQIALKTNTLDPESYGIK
jgi:hypothetical protein